MIMNFKDSTLLRFHFLLFCLILILPYHISAQSEFLIDDEILQSGQVKSYATGGAGFALDIKYRNNMGMMPDLKLATITRSGGTGLDGKEEDTIINTPPCVDNGNEFTMVDLGACDEVFVNTTADTAELSFPSLDLGTYNVTLHVVDNDEDVFIDFVLEVTSFDPCIPTMSEWATFLFLLLITGLGLATIYNVQLAGAPQGGGAIAAPRFHWPFDVALFRKMLPHALGLGAVGLVVILIFWGELLLLDVVGLSVAIPVVAYLLHLMVIIGRKEG